MTLEAVELEFEIPEIPESHGLISGASSENKLRVWIETQTVHLKGAELENNQIGGLLRHLAKKNNPTEY